MVDTILTYVRVFSYEGKLIRRWGNFEIEPGNFENLCRVAIYQDIVYIVDWIVIEFKLLLVVVNLSLNIYMINP